MDVLGGLTGGPPIPEEIMKYRKVYTRIKEQSAQGMGAVLSPEEAQDVCRYMVAMERMLVDAYVVQGRGMKSRTSHKEEHE